jgi:hypothetical protein
MNKRTIVTLTAVLAVLGFAILFGAPKAQNFNSSAAIAAPAPTPVPMAVPMPNRCPNIHGAIDGLRSAEQELRDGAHDFCGHKVAAMRAVHEAIEQLKLAEGCAKCR